MSLWILHDLWVSGYYTIYYKGTIYSAILVEEVKVKSGKHAILYGLIKWQIIFPIARNYPH